MSVAPPSRSRRFAVEWLLLAALLLGTAAVLTVVLLGDERRLRASELDRLQAQARAIDENLSQQLLGADRALNGVAAALARGGFDAEPAVVTAQLSLLSDAMPGFRSMLWLGPDGSVQATTRAALAGLNLADRDYFQGAVRTGDPAGLYVTPPFTSALGGLIMVASKMLVDADGNFAGVVTATLDPAYFGVLLHSVLYAPDMRAALVHSGGAVFLDVGAAGAAATDPSPELPALLAAQQWKPDEPALNLDRTPLAGQPRLAALRWLDRSEKRHERPLVAVVSREASVVLAAWREQAIQDVALLVAVALVATGSLWLDQRRRRDAWAASDAIARERQAAAERLEQALRGADLGLWDLHLPTDTFEISPRERSLLGYGDADPLPQGPAWRELIHPDDRARVAASIVPHLKGLAPAYDCEHRMRHRDGHDVWVSSRAMIVERRPDGTPVRIVGTHLDISERKATAERLALAAAQLGESESQLRLLTDNMPALVSRLDPAQRFRFANRAYAEWLNLEPASLVGRTLVEVYGADAYEGFRQHVAHALGGVKVRYERMLATPGAERRVEFTLVPEFDADGTVTGLYTLATDITARHAAEVRQARSEERLSIALEGSGQALFDWDLVTQVIYRSAEAAVLRGDVPIDGHTSATDLRQDVHPDDLPGMIDAARDALKGVAPLFQAELRIRHVSGDWRWVRARGRVVERNAAGRALRIAGTYADINDHKLEEGRLRRLAEFDTLTGLPNRALFRDRLQQGMARAARGKPMALLFVDVDHFKEINDTLGHEAGDEVLKVFAHRMQSVVRASDTVARLGGDEFTIILEGIRGPADASAIANKLNEALEQPIPRVGDGLRVTASIGVAVCIPGEDDEAALLRRADAALYEAKRRGRNSSFCAELQA